MKSTYLASLAFSALLLGCAIAFAQTPATPPPADPSAMSSTSTQRDTTNGNKDVGDQQPIPADPLSTPRSTGQNKATGNDLVSRNKKPPPENSLSAPPTTGQDKTTGNDLSSPNKSGMQPRTGRRPDFNTLDTHKNGYLTADDVKNHTWVSKNFARCDTDHDGHLSPEEYAKCTK